MERLAIITYFAIPILRSHGTGVGMENRQSQFTINNNYRSTDVTRVEDLPTYPNDETVVGLLLGVSRNRPPFKEGNSPYTLHMTDFSYSRFNFTDYFGGRNFKKKEFINRTFDIVTFPGVFEAINKEVKDIVDLHEKVRYYKFSDGRPHYEDEWKREDLEIFYLKLGIDHDAITKRRSTDEWLLDKYNIWIKARIRGKEYKDKMEFVCLNNFYVIPKSELKQELFECGQKETWEKFAKLYQQDENQHPTHRSFSDDEFSDSDADLHGVYERNDERHEKRRKLATLEVAEAVEAVQEVKEEVKEEKKEKKTGEDVPRRFGGIRYTLIGELADDGMWEVDGTTVPYTPQYLVVRRMRIWRRLDSYVFLHRRKLGIKRVRFVVADERGDELLLHVAEDKLADFLGLSLADFKFIEDLDEAIKARLEEIAAEEDKQYYGMVVSRAQLAPGLHRWTWEYTTAAPLSDGASPYDRRNIDNTL